MDGRRVNQRANQRQPACRFVSWGRGNFALIARDMFSSEYVICNMFTLMRVYISLRVHFIEVSVFPEGGEIRGAECGSAVTY